MDADLAREIREFRSPTDGETRMFYEIVIAPAYTPDGLEVLKGKSKTVSAALLALGSRRGSGRRHNGKRDSASLGGSSRAMMPPCAQRGSATPWQCRCLPN